jgi:hypothetical protein
VKLEFVPDILKLVSTPLALAALVVLLLGQGRGLSSKNGFILSLVLGVVAFCSYTLQTLLPYLFPPQAEVWTVRGNVSTDPDSPLEHADDVVFSSNPPIGQDDPKDNSFIATVVVPRKRDGTLDFPKLHIGREPLSKFTGRTVHLNEDDPLSDTDQRYAVQHYENAHEIIINKAVALTKVPEYKGAGSQPTPDYTPNNR